MTRNPKVDDYLPPNRDPKQPPVCNLWDNRVLPDGGLTLEAKGVTLAQLAEKVGVLLGRQGVDTAGFNDLFDVHFEFANPELGRAGESAGGAGVGVSAAPAAPVRKSSRDQLRVFGA